MEAGRIHAAGTHRELPATDELDVRLVEALRIAMPAAGQVTAQARPSGLGRFVAFGAASDKGPSETL